MKDTTRRCTECGHVKPISEYHKSKNNRGGCAIACRDCRNAYTRTLYAEVVKEEKPQHGSKVCTDCGKDKPLQEFAHNKGKKDGRTSKCRACYRIRYRERYATKPGYKENRKRYVAENKERIAAKAKEYRLKLFTDAMDAYGGRFCVCCGEDEHHFLSIDHMNDDGYAHRKQVGRTIFLWLRQNGYPPGFQVLCMNCNHGRMRNGGVCPHKEG